VPSIQDVRYGAQAARLAGIHRVCRLYLALGMGATSVVFSVLNVLYLQTAAVPKPSELVMSQGMH